MIGKMLAATFEAPQKVILEEIDIPKPEKDEALIKIIYNGICGSDLRTWKGDHWQIKGWPLPPGGNGHEGVGVVVEAGQDSKGIKAGDLVVGFGRRNFSQYTVAKNPRVVNGGNPEKMALCSPLSNALNVTDLTEAERGNAVVVMGQGPIGLLTTQLLVKRGVRVYATDLIKSRMRLSERYGAKVFNASDPEYPKNILEEAGDVKAVAECAGSSETLKPAAEIIGHYGIIVIYGCQNDLVFPYRPLREKGVKVVFGTAGDNWWKGIGYGPIAAKMLLERSVETDDIISAKLPLTSLPEVLEHYDMEKWIKVLIDPWLG